MDYFTENNLSVGGGGISQKGSFLLHTDFFMLLLKTEFINMLSYN